MNLQPNENSCCEEGASHFQNFIAVGGTLCLTNHRLHFTPKAGGADSHEWSSDLRLITDVQLCKTMFMNPNGIAVLMKDGNIENFIVDDRKAWKDRIERELKQTSLR